MDNDISILVLTAITIGFVHTVLGPDHYLPFIVMAKAGKWSKLKTISITFFCGVGHVGSSIVIGVLGIIFGIGIQHITIFESFRGNVAAILFIAFGFAYFIWGLRQAYKNKTHKHVHIHSDGHIHKHEHNHHLEHAHVHQKKQSVVTPWALFLIFVLGPCEPLIPILMYPAAKNSVSGLLLVAISFSLITLFTMLTIVIAAYYGLSFAKLGKLEKYTHALAGFTIFISGMGIQFLGL